MTRATVNAKIRAFEGGDSSGRLSGVYARRDTPTVEMTRVEAMFEGSEEGSGRPRGICSYEGDRISLGFEPRIPAGFAMRQQPFVSESGMTFLIADACLYNGDALRRVLEGKGHAFSTSADAEVILHACEEWGDAAIERLNGAFAFALWQADTKRLLLVRDYAGHRELFYHTSADAVSFSSELPSLLSLPHIRSNVRHESLWNYLLLGFVPEPYTMVRDLYALPAGCLLSVEEGREPECRDWSKVRFTPKIFGGLKEFRGDGAAILRTALERRLRSDRATGLLLNGTRGNAALITFGRSLQLPFFSVRLDSFESKFFTYAAEAASAAGVPYYELVLSPERAVAGLSRLSKLSSAPIGCPEVVLRDAVYEAASGHVDGMLSGEAMEESVAGYPRYQKDYRSFLTYNRAFLRPLAPLFTGLGLITREAEFQRLFAASYLRGDDVLTQNDLAGVFRSEWVQEFSGNDLGEIFATYFKRAGAETQLDRTLFSEQRVVFSPKYFAKHRVLQQRHDIETICPFVDKQWLDWTAALPLRAKQSWFSGARVLGSAFSGRPICFSVDERQEQCAGLGRQIVPMLSAVLERDNFSERWFDTDSLRECCASVGQGESNGALLLWRLLAFFQWAEMMKLEN